MNDANGLPQITIEADQMTAPWQITLAAIGACLSLILMSVEAKAGDDRPEPSNLERIASELALSEEQAKQVDQILSEAVERRAGIRDASDGKTKEQVRAALKAITEDADRQLRGVLSDEQFARYVALRAQLRRDVLRERIRDTRWKTY